MGRGGGRAVGLRGESIAQKRGRRKSSEEGREAALGVGGREGLKDGEGKEEKEGLRRGEGRGGGERGRVRDGKDAVHRLY